MRSGLCGLLILIAGCGNSDGGGSGQTPSPPTSGLVARPDNTSCLAPDSAGSTAIRWQPAFPELPSLSGLVGLLQAPADDSVFYAVRKSGLVQRFANQPTAATLTTVLNLSGRVQDSGESGLLGFAFHPQYASNGEVYVYYTGGSPLSSYLSRIVRRGDGTLNAADEDILLTLAQPYSNHNGGQLAFGPDGFLYLALGDGGSGGDPHGHGQNPQTLLGSILRLDINNGTPYAIPADNPFANGVGGRPEIYAWGLRNPWRFSFDRSNGELWAADVGQNAWEEINKIERGGNYGWAIMEGQHCYAADSCNQTGLKQPVFEYSHSEGCSVTGGYVYRGSALPALQGRYLFSDYCSAQVWSLLPQPNGSLQVEMLTALSGNPSSFAEDNQGELYALLLSGSAGENIYRMHSADNNPGSVAERLSQSGCVSASSPSQPIDAAIPYAINSPFWSDGADKERFVAIPNGSQITVHSDGDFQFPTGSVLMKHFRLAGQLIETRLFMRHSDGWRGYSYEWRADQSDADLLTAGKDRQINGQLWHFPSGSECLQCHTQAAGFVLGAEAGQLNRALHYPRSGISANQLDTWQYIGWFRSHLSTTQRAMQYAEPDNQAASLNARARSYLHSNCSHCHRPDAAPVAMDLRHATALADTATCDVLPQSGALGVADARLLVPGAPDRSLLHHRMNRRDGYAMPPLASAVVDSAGVSLIADWISSLANCH
ncbi:MAG: PQQ-dependent sugar dehydrogenase [Pseudomonadota bacterium]